MPTLHVALSPDDLHFLLTGGSAGGRDEIHRTVTRWPGWKRERLVTTSDLRGGIMSVYKAPCTAVTAAALDQTSLTLTWEEDAYVQASKLLADLFNAKMALENPSKRLPGQTLPTDRIPMPHQWAAIEAMRALRWRCLLADDMGLGKTSETLWGVHDCGAKRVLVVCPVSAKWNWGREIEDTLGCTWWVRVIDGTSRQRATHFTELSRIEGNWGRDQLAVIINYDLLAHLTKEQQDWLREFVANEFLICDESHYIKNRKSERTKLVAKIGSGARYRVLATGTPVRNMVDDLYSQIDMIHPGTWTSYWDFAKRHLTSVPITMGARKINKITGSRDMKGLNAVVNTMQIRRFNDVLGLPPKTHTYPELELDADTRKVYKAMKEFALLKLNELPDDASIFQPRASSAVAAAMRCEQIAQGFVGGIPEPLMEKLGKIIMKRAEKIPGRPNELMFPRSPKIAWLIETLDCLMHSGKRPVVFGRFNAPLFWLAEHYGGRLLHGALTSTEKGEVVHGFCEGEGLVLFAQIKMAEGWNAHTSQDAIFLSRDWSPAVNSQAEGRLHRIGQQGTVNIQIPVVRGTIEVMIHRKLEAKGADAEQALRTVTVKELKEAL